MKPYLSLFQRKIEIVFVGLILLFVFICNIILNYIDFREFKSHSWATVRGEIANIIPLVAKDGRAYKRLYVKSDSGHTITIVFWSKEEINLNARVGFRVKTEEVNFGSFLSRKFYAPSVLAWHKSQIDSSVKNRIDNFIQKQHDSQIMKELFSTLYLATPISKELRDKVQRFGITHVIAISGYHLGIIFAFLYAIFMPIYRFFQDRYFPYRNARWDISVIIFAFLGYYLWLIDMTPSFLRSYVMGVCGFLFLWRGINVLTFEMLALTTAFLIALFPYLAFNIGFILSVFGVFFIFVFIKHFPKLKVWQTLLLLNLWLFIAMNPIVYYWFNVINIQQWISIPLSILFVIFYPFVTFLHAINQGGLLDGHIINFLSYETKSAFFNTPVWLLAIYVCLAFLSAFRAIFMLPILIIGVSYFFFLL
ncbi:MAG: ComEC/Rec2 family competence protein [Campylobacteraceae bacterium]|jgi:competence protein ComEC|nr:ComEC/Rec2 family competence protein [Campylobacteraceae bacterium]